MGQSQVKGLQSRATPGDPTPGSPATENTTHGSTGHSYARRWVEVPNEPPELDWSDYDDYLGSWPL